MFPWRPVRPPDPLRQRLPEVTAKGIAAMIQAARLGRCEVMRGELGWVVLVFGDDGADPLVLATLTDAQPLLALASRFFTAGRGPLKDRRRSSLPPEAENQVRRELGRLSAKEEAEGLPRGPRGEVQR